MEVKPGSQLITAIWRYAKEKERLLSSFLFQKKKRIDKFFADIRKWNTSKFLGDKTAKIW